MLSNLKSFYNERQIDVTTIIDTIKQEKRMSGCGAGSSNERSAGAYWELVKLIFTAFYLDHTQNAFLTGFFTTGL